MLSCNCILYYTWVQHCLVAQCPWTGPLQTKFSSTAPFSRIRVVQQSWKRLASWGLYIEFWTLWNQHLIACWTNFSHTDQQFPLFLSLKFDISCFFNSSLNSYCFFWVTNFSKSWSCKTRGLFTKEKRI